VHACCCRRHAASATPGQPDNWCSRCFSPVKNFTPSDIYASGAGLLVAPINVPHLFYSQYSSRSDGCDRLWPWVNEATDQTGTYAMSLRPPRTTTTTTTTATISTSSTILRVSHVPCEILAAIKRNNQRLASTDVYKSLHDGADRTRPSDRSSKINRQRWNGRSGCLVHCSSVRPVMQ